MQLTSDANYFVNAKSHAREKQLLTGCLYTVVVYQFSEHKAQLYSTCILCIHPLIIGFYHGSGKSLIIMMCLLNVGFISQSLNVNVTVVYHKRN